MVIDTSSQTLKRHLLEYGVDIIFFFLIALSHTLVRTYTFSAHMLINANAVLVCAYIDVNWRKSTQIVPHLNPMCPNDS